MSHISGDIAIFESVLTQDVLNRAWRYACRLAATHEDAEDLLQESLAHALTRISQLNDLSKFKSWLMSIIRTRFLTQVRKQKVAVTTVATRDEDLSELIVDYRGTPESDSLVEEVAHALSRLPHSQKELLTLFYLDELSLVETGDVLGISAGAVQQRLFRARAALRREILKGNPQTEAVARLEMDYENH